jgi:hypothetical protein
MRLCMFHPVGHPLERGWVGRVEDDHVVQLAAQTIQAFFTGGGRAREHAVYALERVDFLAPVLHPPSVRLFESEHAFEFANPAAVLGPNTEVRHRTVDEWLHLDLGPRLAAVVGERGEIGGYTILADWRAPALPAPKDRDFALGLGPFVVTPDETLAAREVAVRIFDEEVLRTSFDTFDWHAACEFAAADTMLRSGDILAGPAPGNVEGIEIATVVHVEVPGIGTLSQSVQPPVELD